MPQLSVVLIVKNEAACLGECLESVRAIADEVLVADTGSTDDTRTVASAAGARVVEIPWENDFSKARNRATASATADWILQIDADEALDPQGARRVRELVDGDGDGADAFELVQANYCDNPRAWRWVNVTPGDPYARGFSGYLAVDIIRLFRNRQGYEYREPIHENLTESVQERGGRIRHEAVLIHHYGFAASGERAISKAWFYLELCREKAQQHPESLKAWRDLAEQAWACGEEAEAEMACQNALRIDPLYLDSATTLGGLWMTQGKHAEARALFERLEGAGISPPHLVTALAVLDCREGQLDRALQRAEAVLAATPNAPMAQLCLARVLDRMGRPAESERAIQSLAAMAPSIGEFQSVAQARAHRVRGEAHFADGNLTEALAAFVEALRLDPEDPYLHNDLGVALHALGETQRAREAFVRARTLANGLPEAEENLRCL